MYTAKGHQNSIKIIFKHAVVLSTQHYLKKGVESIKDLPKTVKLIEKFHSMALRLFPFLWVYCKDNCMW